MYLACRYDILASGSTFTTSRDYIKILCKKDGNKHNKAMTTAKSFGASSLPKYKQNLAVKYAPDGSTAQVFSYSTHVADIDNDKNTITARGWYSVTTSKHIAYVARELGYKLIKSL